MRLIRGISQSLCALLLLLTSAAHAAQNQEQRIRNIVLVHGAWADGSGWKGVCDILVKADQDVEVVANIGLSRNASGAFVLSAALPVTMAGVDQSTGQQLVKGAHAICPCANAIKGNVDVQTTVSVREKEAGEAA